MPVTRENNDLSPKNKLSFLGFTAPAVPWAASFFLSLVLLGVTGCERSNNLGLGIETDEPNYRLGQQLERSGSQQEALVAFLKVIQKRGEDAPESHLEAGIIYAQYVKDPIAAIYHFQKYLELKPNSPQAELVRQRIDAAKRDFARTLPAQPAQSQADRLDLLDLVDRLKRENEQLKVDLAAARTGAPIISDNSITARSAPRAVPQQQGSQATPRLSFGAANRSAPGNSANNSRSIANTASANTARNTPPGSTAQSAASASGHRHQVSAGDTLYKISLRYYGDSRHVDQIYEANKDVMKSPNDLKVGMELKLP